MTLIISSTACDFEFILSFVFVPNFHIGHDGGLQPVESAMVEALVAATREIGLEVRSKC